MDKKKLSGRIKNMIVVLILYVFIESYTISEFDQFAFTEATTLKFEVLQLLDSANEPFENHQKRIDEITTRLHLLYDYEKKRENNQITIRLWDKLLDKKGNLFGGFLTFWKNDNKLSDSFIMEVKKLISLAFDQIIELESKK